MHELVSTNRVGESREGSVRGEQVMQQAEKNEDSDTQSGEEEITMMRSSAQQAVFVQNIQMIAERQCRRTTRSRIW